MKSYSLVLFEAVVVGICLILFYYLTGYVLRYVNIDNILIQLFISGALFHLVFEYTGINEWYSIKYCDILAK